VIREVDDGAVEAAVGQRQPRHVLPIDARAHGMGRLEVREPLSELQNGDQCQPPVDQPGIGPAEVEGGQRVQCRRHEALAEREGETDGAHAGRGKRQTVA